MKSDEVTTYIFGAGFNCSLAASAEPKRPPFVANDFFRELLSHPPRNAVGLDVVLAYIAHYWNRDRESLASTDFDLEECFTLPQLQVQDPSFVQPPGIPSPQTLMNALRDLLADYLSEGMYRLASSDQAVEFARRVREERAWLITFNYDTVLEDALLNTQSRAEAWLLPEFMAWQVANIRGDVPDAVIKYPFTWAYPLGYGFRFNHVQLIEWPGNAMYVDGSRYYDVKGEELYDRPVLKLHGSVNWIHVRDEAGNPGILLDDTATYRLVGGSIISPYQSLYDQTPLMITPVLYKRYEDDPYAVLWATARDALTQTSHLVIVGYSFPATDFGTRRLLLEVFSERQLQRLTIVNPNDDARARARSLTHEPNTIQAFNNLDEFLAHS